MHFADWVVLGIFIVTMVAIGAWANRRQTDTEAYFVGNRSMPWWAAGLSIIANSFSAVAPTNWIPGLTGVEEAVVIFGVIAIIYTVMGGISAVIWTDVI